jgi:hypothetical protein
MSNITATEPEEAGDITKVFQGTHSWVKSIQLQLLKPIL